MMKEENLLQNTEGKKGNKSFEVSVIIPTYNRAELLNRAIESVLNQTYDNTEIIIVDDASTDHTKQLIENLQNNRIHYIYNEKNMGASAARNIGIKKAKSQLIAFLDSDDVWHKDKLKLQVEALKNAPDTVGMVYCEYKYYQIDGSSGVCPDKDIPLALKMGDMFLSLLILPMIGTPSMLIRKSCLEHVGLFDESYPCLEDYELSLRIAKEYDIAFVPQVLFEAYARSESVTNNVKGMFEAKIAIMKKYYADLKQNNLLDVVTAALLEKAQELGIKQEVNDYLKQQLSAEEK